MGRKSTKISAFLGTGKTSFLSVIYNECKEKKIKVKFFQVSCGDALKEFLGQSEQFVKYLFKKLANNIPCILFLGDLICIIQKNWIIILYFLDECDGLCAKRSNSSNQSTLGIKTELLRQIKTTYNGIHIIGATNFPHVITSVLLFSKNWLKWN